jgi:hypothetical protein
VNQYRLKAVRGDGTVSELTMTLDELLRPNGDLPFVAWWLREAETTGCDRVQVVTVETGLLGGDYEQELAP